MSDSSTQAFCVLMVTPVYRDWESASLLCRKLDECCDQAGVQLSVLMVDDGSPDGMAGWQPFEPRKLQSMDVLFLRRNLGHQKAIATGLVHAEKLTGFDAVLVMDADGEDRPEDALRLIKTAIEQTQPKVVFAERRKRMEGRVFKTGYVVYRHLHKLLTGIPVRMGNFSVVPHRFLRRLVTMPEIWTHYVAGVLESKLPVTSIPTDRGTRYRGKSHMNLVSLVNHGLAGIATFQMTVATRILLAVVALMALALVALAGVLIVRLTTSLAVPGWATFSAGLLLLLLAQLAAVAFSMVFTLISTRTNAQFIPVRDCGMFVDQVERIWPV